MRHILGAIVTAAGVFGATVATAGDFYLGLNGGLNLAGDMDLEGTGIDREAALDAGAGVAASAGYGFDNGLRAEAEFAYRWNGLDEVSGSNASGDVTALSGMLNALYDVKTDTAFTPYLGAGAGAVRVVADDVSPVAGTRIDDNDIALAMQGIAGLSYRVDDQWSLTADYQYFAAPEVNFRTDSGIDIESEYSAHTFRIGFRFDFGGPSQEATTDTGPVTMAADAADAGAGPAAAEVSGPPRTPKRFVAFFDWDSADLKPQALEVVGEAADLAKGKETIRVAATGHADRSGSERYNMELSKRRAFAVRDELVRRGVASDKIEVAWKGEKNPRLPTPDGQREAKNRRVEIFFP